MRAAALLLGGLIVAGCGGGGAMRVPEPRASDTIAVTSPAFSDGQPIPREYTCRGAGRFPDLAWRGVPSGSASLALVVSDPDAPKGTFIHWLLYDLPPYDGGLAGGTVPPGSRAAENSGGKTGWYPPCPPSGTHRYVFTVYALSQPVRERSTQDILDELGRHAVALGTLTGVVSGA